MIRHTYMLTTRQKQAHLAHLARHPENKGWFPRTAEGFHACFYRLMFLDCRLPSGDMLWETEHVLFFAWHLCRPPLSRARNPMCAGVSVACRNQGGYRRIKHYSPLNKVGYTGFPEPPAFGYSFEGRAYESFLADYLRYTAPSMRRAEQIEVIRNIQKPASEGDRRRDLLLK